MGKTNGYSGGIDAGKNQLLVAMHVVALLKHRVVRRLIGQLSSYKRWQWSLGWMVSQGRFLMCLVELLECQAEIEYEVNNLVE